MVTLTVSSPSPKSKTEDHFSKLRHSHTHSKVRKADEANLDDVSPVQCANKKLKVTFDIDPENSNMVEEYQENVRSLETVRGEVKRAIETHLKGNSECYDIIKAIFSPNNRDDYDKNMNRVEMKYYLLALTNSTCLLSKSCSGLVRAVLSMEWIGRDEMFVKVYIVFLGSLASAQGVYVESILQMLAGYFLGGRMHFIHFNYLSF